MPTAGSIHWEPHRSRFSLCLWICPGNGSIEAFLLHSASLTHCLRMFQPCARRPQRASKTSHLRSSWEESVQMPLSLSPVPLSRSEGACLASRESLVSLSLHSTVSQYLRHLGCMIHGRSLESPGRSGFLKPSRQVPRTPKPSFFLGFRAWPSPVLPSSQPRRLPYLLRYVATASDDEREGGR